MIEARRGPLAVRGIRPPNARLVENEDEHAPSGATRASTSSLSLSAPRCSSAPSQPVHPGCATTQPHPAQHSRRGLRAAIHSGARGLEPRALFQDLKHRQRLAVEQCRACAVVVMDSRKGARAASAGPILITRLVVQGAAGIVIDGRSRDSPGRRHSRSTTASPRRRPI